MTPVRLELRLKERLPDRVQVAVALTPTETELPINGIAVEIFCRKGLPLSPRLLLPIAGIVHQEMISTVELRAFHEIPRGSRVVATVWWQGGQLEGSCPTEMWTILRSHIRGCRRLSTYAPRPELEPVEAEDRAILATLFPWVDEPMIPAPPPSAVFEPIEKDSESPADDIQDAYDLDEESAEWLRDLMSDGEA